MRDWFSFQNAANGVAEIHILDVIGQTFDGSGVTAKAFVDQLAQLPANTKTLRVHVNSVGGSVFDALAIMNAIRAQHLEKGRSVQMIVDGIAASAASVVLMAGQTIRMSTSALIMIHDPVAIGFGTAAEHRKLADALDTVRDSSIIDAYRLHSSLKPKAIRDLMAAETWMDADMAISNGFATEKVEGLKAAASLDPRAVANLTIPAEYRDRIAALVTPAPAPSATAADPRDVLRLCREGECLDLAESLLADSLPVDAVQAAIASERDRRTAAEARTTEIRALCRHAHLDALADGYVLGGMSAADVRSHLTTITAAIDDTEIDGALPPDQGTRRKPVIDVTAVYAERNQLTRHKE